MFLHRLLTSHGVQWRPIHERPADVWFAHLLPQYIESVRSHAGPLMMTAREWGRVEASWIRRGESGFEQSKSYFDELRHRAFVLEIDGRDRDEQLKQLSVMVGVSLETDWEPV